MTERDIEQLLADTFARRAGDAVDDRRIAPPPRFAAATGSSGPPRRRWPAALASAAAVLVAVVAGVLIAHPGAPRTVAGTGGVRPPTATASPTTVSSSAAAANPLLAPVRGRPVTLRLDMPPRAGVGLPVTAYFSRLITDGRALTAATTVTADGQRLDAQWYFQASPVHPSTVIGSLRPRTFWPAHRDIAVSVATRHLSAGRGLAFANSAAFTFRTGAAYVATVSDHSHRLFLRRDGRRVAALPVSLGAAATPTKRGIKVIMSKGASVCMRGPGYSECGIRDVQQLTDSGEYLHSAPWNIANIGRRDTSNGCTNLTPGGAKLLYQTLGVGDVVEYPDATGPRMSLADGFGYWNVSWRQWLTGGAVRTH